MKFEQYFDLDLRSILPDTIQISSYQETRYVKDTEDARTTSLNIVAKANVELWPENNTLFGTKSTTPLLIKEDVYVDAGILFYVCCVYE